MDDMTHRTDDEIRAALFEQLVDRLREAAIREPLIDVHNANPLMLSVSRDGNLLTVSQGTGQRFLSVDLKWKYRAEDPDDPWRQSVSRTPDQRRLVLLPDGNEGSIAEIVTVIVTTFLERTKPATT